ncbi:MAG TPA: hypothetical protein VFQ81_04565 [Candidatus Limnocylindria bacterium]|nr:hypothetical protein [Candidatus Limnocylindria bacterium]
MTRHPFNSGELGRDDPELMSLAEELEGLAVADPRPRAGFHDRVLAAIDAEPARRRSWVSRLFAGDGRQLLQAAALALVLVVGITTAFLAGGILDGLRRTPGTGPPLPSPSDALPTITPSPSLSASPSPSSSPSPSASPSTAPSASVDDASETPRPSESDNSGPGGGDDESETPRPSESGNSGPGGGDDD